MTIHNNAFHYTAKKDVADVFIAEGFTDTSYGNDITASFCLYGSTMCFKVSVFHADQNKRENNEPFRFYSSVWSLVDGEPDDLIWECSPTNDIDCVLHKGSNNND